ncbi:Ribokinase-like protein [Scheffersomyces amazonensis]|uniref:Ribokinase-like protein n=1 Tax=Scheffersomyces amazonensis TaxID=1078765 RepID=UPI00315CF7E3
MAKNILSISSHVVHGYVGNRATVFPLQYYGWDVDAVNTTNFSNHPGYGTFEGKPSTAELVGDIFQGLKDILDLHDNYDMILTGYTPGDQVLEVIYEQVLSIFKSDKDNDSDSLTSSKKKPIWIVDPVLGDNGRLYVSEKVIPVYKKIFSSGYVGLTSPNQFEFEILSDTKISDWNSVKQGLENFYKLYRVPNVVISSVIVEDKMYSVGYSRPNPEDKATVFYFPIDQISCNFNGCGDLFTALLANSFYENGCKLNPVALGEVVVKLNLILQHSYEQEQQVTGQDIIKVVKDIRIISSRHYLLQDKTHDPLIAKVAYL